MRFLFPPGPPEKPLPKGKWTIKRNVYGNWNGYIGSRKVKEFGCGLQGEMEAGRWLANDPALLER